MTKWFCSACGIGSTCPGCTALDKQVAALTEERDRLKQEHAIDLQQLAESTVALEQAAHHTVRLQATIKKLEQDLQFRVACETLLTAALRQKLVALTEERRT